jgi:aminoglycoside 2'-N-acetyltransferase I
MRTDVRPISGLTEEERAALRSLAVAVYSPEVEAAWPGRLIEWAARQSSVIVWDDTGGQALAHAGLLTRQARWNDGHLKVGGVGGVMTHPEFRGRGFASAAVNHCVQFFREQGDIDFGLLVCEPHLVPFYERLGWRFFSGELFVAQHGKTTKFTLCGTMTIPVRLQAELSGTIDLLGPPW